MPAVRSAAAAMAMVVIAGCGSAGSTKAVPHTPSAAPMTSTHGLHVGQTHRDDGVSTTLLEVDYPYTGDQKYRPEPGTAFIGLMVRTCLDQNAARGTLTASNSDWSIGNEHPDYSGTAAVSWTDWPLPKYPEHAHLAPGQCREGWLLLQGPEDEKLTRVTYRPADGRAVAWVGTFVRD